MKSTHKNYVLSFVLAFAGMAFGPFLISDLMGTKAYACNLKLSRLDPTCPESILNLNNGTSPSQIPTQVSQASSIWSGWSEVPGGNRTDVSLSATTYNGQLYLIGKRLGTNRVYQNVFNGSSWTGWSEVPGNGMTERSLASTSYNGRLYLFGKGAGGNQVYVNSGTP
jgi:hypothetical protein